MIYFRKKGQIEEAGYYNRESMTPKAFRRPLMEINGIWRGLIENLPPQHQISLGKDLNRMTRQHFANSKRSSENRPPLLNCTPKVGHIPSNSQGAVFL
ncbi:hypothetical protein NEISICOT_03364 [Neisseria sicca ATCC 29256]|uniref:Uncharacterized protein n=1 Tax=Neisseria sicca ATCC 29256 TaxID=547045 RepID=C6M9Y2_NEISI|nr:hypothetical protein NEISICOT_03364 [Neisseria sicca ATCC 29256]